MSIKNSTTIFTIWVTLTIVFLVVPYLQAGFLALINLAFLAASIWAEDK